MTPNKFFLRIALMAAVLVVASLIGAISSSWWAACLLGIGGAMLFTMVSERLLRGKVTTPITSVLKGAALTWYAVQLVLELVSIAVIGTALGMLCGVHILDSVRFAYMSGLVSAFLCLEALTKILTLLPLWLATRR